ncbi:transglutaminase family protein [Streptomyces sp. NPDC006529]|uniref:transglutaminase-like domain-containing protein n=1 Tax=Streptomyces sp. NPDC006529 TaxID=3157177 RepID=UPI0033A6AFC9
MELIPEHPGLAPYLAADEAIDHGHPLVRQTADTLWAATGDAYTYAESAFAFVRDTIPHSNDAGDLRVTWRASDVLERRTGICYAKAHALTALLRARDIPTGLCYQLLGDDDGSRAVVHGLIALRLPGRDTWSRLDPRGNKPGVDARFSLDTERLAFPVRPELGEIDYPGLYATPPAPVLHALRTAPDRVALWDLLPTGLQAA